MRFYLDTCIWVDLLETREGTPAAKAFLKKAVMKEWTILYSDLAIMELKRLGHRQAPLQIPQLQHIHCYRHQITEAKRLAKARRIPRSDALHAVLARDSEAVLISRDRHFASLKDVVENGRPEDY